MNINRRRILELGVSASVLAVLPLVGACSAETLSKQLLQTISDAKGPIDEAVTGSLGRDEFASLATLCHFVDKAWELEANLPAYLGQLESDLGLKTSKPPSYLAEYRHALDLIELVSDASENIEQTWTTLLFAEFDMENFANTKIGRARRFVFSEIIAHQVPISGGFKSFGWVNYRGYFGGPYASPTSYTRGAL